jgi:hypothetical protein
MAFTASDDYETQACQYGRLFVLHRVGNDALLVYHLQCLKRRI